MTMEIARNISRILVRAFFYSRLEPKVGQTPTNWEAYIGQFCDHGALYKPAAVGQIRNYLQAQFNLEFESTKELQSLVDLRATSELAEDLLPIKTSPGLADNDALMTHAIYGRRKALEERSGISEFGYKTWWLTGETRILRYTKEIVRKNQGARFMMRPEFLLNFISLSPSAAEVRKAYREIFPSLLGVRLGSRMDEEVFETLMKSVDEVSELEEGRRLAKIAQMTDELKSDFWRRYGTNFS